MLKHSVDKKIVLRQDLRAEEHTVMGDASLLQNLILNLALNARDAMPSGGRLEVSSVSVELDAAACARQPFELEPGTYVRVRMTDNGSGMDAETQRHIFEPFFTTKEAGRGTGLGLAAAYGTIKSHKGAIVVSSQPNQGTQVDVLLPTTQSVPASTRPGRATNESIGRDSHVLLVEDDVGIRDVVERMLGGLGCKVSAFADGGSAIGFYERAYDSIDLVILDMVMPKMNGRELFAALRAINPGVKALIASGYGLDTEVRATIAEGVKGFIQKPFGREALAEKVAEMLGPSAIRGAMS